MLSVRHDRVRSSECSLMLPSPPFFPRPHNAAFYQWQNRTSLEDPCMKLDTKSQKIAQKLSFALEVKTSSTAFQTLLNFRKFYLRLKGGGKLSLDAHIGDWAGKGSNKVVANGKWQCVGGVYDGKEIKVALNGKFVAEFAPSSQSNVETADSYLGCAGMCIVRHTECVRVRLCGFRQCKWDSPCRPSLPPLPSSPFSPCPSPLALSTLPLSRAAFRPQCPPRRCRPPCQRRRSADLIP